MVKKFIAICNNTEEYLAATLLISASAIVFMQVVFRYIGGFTLIWVEEAARYIIVWFIFLGSSMAVRQKKHATVDALVGSLKPKLRLMFEIVAIIICVIICAVILYSGWNVVLTAHQFGTRGLALQIPLFVPFASVPVGMALMIIRYIFQLRDAIVELFGLFTQKGGNA